MCQRTTCPNCQRPSYAGCGRHVEQVLGDVAPSDRCQCDERSGAASGRRARSWFGGRRG